MTEPDELLAQVTKFHAEFITYRDLLRVNQFEGAEKRRSKLREDWAEIEPDVAELGIPMYFQIAGTTLDIFEVALRQFDSYSDILIYESIDQALASLEKTKGRLRRLIRMGTEVGSPPPNISKKESPKAFVVHGHQTGYREAVARLLEKLGIEPVILMEKPDQSMTVIEKLEEHADVPYSIVLMTPDDVGHPANAPEAAKPRARQNVVLELGYFMGRLGRSNVAVLHAGNLELPSDMAGILYIPLENDGWKLRLAGELKASGFDIDLNKLTD